MIIDSKTKEILKKYIAALSKLEDRFYTEVYNLEQAMEKETKIKEIEFFMMDGEYVGIGTADRAMALIPREELEDKKHE